MNKYDFILAIDCDVHKNGIAFLDVKKGDVKYTALPFPQSVEYIRAFASEYSNYMVIIEGGWLNKKSNFHGGHGGVSDMISKKVGANHQVGKILVQYCEFYNIKHEVVRPLNKMWGGKKDKISHEEMSWFIKIGKRSNQDERDAILLAWHYAGLPLRISSR